MGVDFLFNAFYRFGCFFKYELSMENIKIKREYKKRLLLLKNKYYGKRCFIIGNGPSLTPNDLEQLKDEYCFASNRIFYIYNSTTWRPTFYCAQDEDVFKDISDKLDDIISQSENIFFVNYCKKYTPASVISMDNVLFYNARRVAAHKNRKFSKDITRFVDGGGAITYAAMQIAVYLGFKEIYLLGVDHNYAASSFKDGKISESDVKNSYFKGMPTNIKLSKPNTDNTTISYIEARKFADKHNIRIYNATRGGRLEVFERKTLEDVLEKDENEKINY